MISADLHALMVRRGSGKGALWCVYVGGRGGGRGRRGTSWPEVNYPTPQVPYIPLELELQQLFQELAGEVRRWGRAKWIPSSSLPRHITSHFTLVSQSLCA